MIECFKKSIDLLCDQLNIVSKNNEILQHEVYKSRIVHYERSNDNEMLIYFVYEHHLFSTRRLKSFLTYTQSCF